MTMRFKVLMLVAPLLAAATGCGEEALTAKEALMALEEVALSSQAETSSSGTVEIATNFTIGAALEAAAEELEEFISSQLPCAEITLDGAVLNIEYGVNPGNCTYHGQTYTGSHSIEIVSAESGNLVVHHEWTDLSNEQVSVSGTADVTWSSADGSRNVVHQLSWTRLYDGFAVTGSGDRTQTAHPEGLLVGLHVDGTREWTSERGDWDIDINDVQLRWTDPVPEQGTYELITPFEGRRGTLKTATLTFERVDEDTIRVTLASGDKSFAFDVSKLGVISEADE
jgi:hypothetical protein